MKQILLVRPFSGAALKFLPEGTKAINPQSLHTMAAATVVLGRECPTLALGDSYVMRPGDEWLSFRVTGRNVIHLEEEFAVILTGDILGPSSLKVSGWTHEVSGAEIFWSLGFRQNEQIATLGHLIRDL